jgi:hypothetical protein
MGLYINTRTDGIDEAVKYAEDHVIISKRDLRRIKRLAQKLGFWAELKALKINVEPLAITGEGT